MAQNWQTLFQRPDQLVPMLTTLEASSDATAAAPAALTDSTTGTPGSTLIAVRTDTAAHVAADVIVDLASLNAQINSLITQLKAAGVLT